MEPVYLDYAATTPVDPRVAERMVGCLTRDGIFGNPASRSHIYGWRAEEAVEAARREVADLINADPREIVWTSGATEADNLAIKGVAEVAEQGRHIVTSRIEHKAVLDPCHYLARRGWDVTWLEPGADSLISADQVAAALRADTVLVSIMHANNELGTLNDIAAMGAICRERGVLFHVDAAQTVGKVPVDVVAQQVDLLSISAHKLYGPKGIGALYVRRRPPVTLAPQIHGGGHERGMRSGTLPTHQIVGFGHACALAKSELTEESARILRLRKLFLEEVGRREGVTLNGHPDRRVPGIANVSFAGVDGEALLLALREVAVSTGSACTSASLDPSYVLKAIGLPDELAHASIRFSFGRFTTEEEVRFAAARVDAAVAALRG